MNMSEKLIICSAILLQFLMNSLYSQSQDIRFEHILDDQLGPTIGINWINDIHADKSGTLWISTFGAGLTKFEPDSHKFTPIKEVSIRFLFWMHDDMKGNLWIGTAGSGLL